MLVCLFLGIKISFDVHLIALLNRTIHKKELSLSILIEDAGGIIEDCRVLTGGNCYRKSIQFENMFCPKCGRENPDTNQFCGVCGAPLIISPTPENPKHHGAYAIGFGLFILLTMYLMPIAPTSEHGMITLADFASICGNPYGSLVFSGCSKNSWASSWIIYGGWILAIYFIVYGLTHKTDE